jgi:hypothetical protein
MAISHDVPPLKSPSAESRPEYNGANRADGHSRAYAHTKAVLNRVSRAIGHLSAVRAMVGEGRDCFEVLIQLSAVRSAINARENGKAFPFFFGNCFK